jgi:tRNA dimethylallyltransferase
MSRSFFLVGPTASGKSDIAADVARKCVAEIVSADAYQIYEGLDLLSARPDAGTLAKVQHHLIGAVSLSEEMNAEKYRLVATAAIEDINGRNKLAIVVGGSGLYIRALTHGFTARAAANKPLRDELNALSLDDLQARLRAADPAAIDRVDGKNKRRLVRALEIATTSDGVARNEPRHSSCHRGVFVYRERDELYDRINRRVEVMFAGGVVEEVRHAADAGATASQMIGFSDIRALLGGKMNRDECVAAIQQNTRRYAKRQFTWFRHQTTFEPLNLSLLNHAEAVEWILQKARQSLAPADD